MRGEGVGEGAKPHMCLTLPIRHMWSNGIFSFSLSHILFYFHRSWSSSTRPHHSLAPAPPCPSLAPLHRTTPKHCTLTALQTFSFPKLAPLIHFYICSQNRPYFHPVCNCVNACCHVLIALVCFSMS